MRRASTASAHRRSATSSGSSESNQDKHNEICDTLQPRVWGYKEEDAGRHATPDEVVEKLRGAWAQDDNLLLNTGPLPDGSIDSTDEATLREVGRRLRAGALGP